MTLTCKIQTVICFLVVILSITMCTVSYEGKKSKTTERKKDSTDNKDILALNNQVKSSESNILVLDQMIE